MKCVLFCEENWKILSNVGKFSAVIKFRKVFLPNWKLMKIRENSNKIKFGDSAWETGTIPEKTLQKDNLNNLKWRISRWNEAQYWMWSLKKISL